MTRILHKDPILEAVCEFSLDAPDWDWTVPGLVYGQIKDRFPVKSEAPEINFTIQQTAEGVTPTVEQNRGRMQFWGENRHSLVQVGEGVLSIHLLNPYSSWVIFKSMIEGVLSDYEAQSPFRAIKGMSLRYINRLPWPGDGVPIEHVLHVMPQIPDSRDQTWISWFQHVDIWKPELNAILGVRSGHLPRKEDFEDPEGSLESRGIMLDLQFRHVGKEPLERGNVSSWLEIAHGEIETMFFSSLQEEYLQRFEPEVINE